MRAELGVDRHGDAYVDIETETRLETELMRAKLAGRAIWPASYGDGRPLPGVRMSERGHYVVVADDDDARRIDELAGALRDLIGCAETGADVDSLSPLHAALARARDALRSIAAGENQQPCPTE